MRLQRVQIPNFRVLKNIDITFEDYHTPQIFPLASQNGGGKSTFLQLIFTLLNCFHGDHHQELIENLFRNTGVENILINTNFSTIILTDEEYVVELDYYILDDSSLSEKFLLKLDESGRNTLNMYGGIGGCDDLIEHFKDKIEEIQQEISLLEGDEKYLASLWERKGVEPAPLSLHHLSELSTLCYGLVVNNNHDLSAESILSSLRKEIRKRHLLLEDSNLTLQRVIGLLLEVKTLLVSDGIQLIYCKSNFNLVCKVTSRKRNGVVSRIFNKDAVRDLLKKISNSVFAAAPASQVFLFLSPEDLSLLFLDTSSYHKILTKKQGVVSNLFLYEFSIIKILADAFSKAIENDKIQAIRSGGNYGNEYKILVNNLKNFLDGKTIQPSEDMSEIVIKQHDKNNKKINIHPADLSHGELRRLSFYAWLKTNRIKNSIILIDEIEIGLHPDWQYQIVRDLEAWEPSNQYILATHSYEICSALSPAHVKEIEPKLLKSEAKTAQ